MNHLSTVFRKKLSSLSPTSSIDSTLSKVKPSSKSPRSGSELSCSAVDDNYKFYPSSISNKHFNATLKLVNNTVYLNPDTDSRLTSVEGCLTIAVKKRIIPKDILITFNGHSLTNLCTSADPLIVSNSSVKHHFISQQRLWNYSQDSPQNDNKESLPSGCYNYPFEFFLDGSVDPESIQHFLGDFFYYIEVKVELYSPSSKELRPEIFKLSKKLQVIKCLPSSSSVVNNSYNLDDSIAIGNWRDLLYYQLTLNSKVLIINNNDFNNLNVSFSVLPIKRFNYKLHSIKITLVQTTDYDIESLDLGHSINGAIFVKSLQIVDKIPIFQKKITIDDLNEEDGGSFDHNTTLPISDSYFIKSTTNKNKTKLVNVYPTIESPQDFLRLQVSHKLKVSIILEELSTSVDDSMINSSRSSSIYSIPTLGQVHAPIYSAAQTRDSKFNNDDKDWIKANARKVQETNKAKNKRIELALTTKAVILKNESELGNMPPPLYENELIPTDSRPFDKILLSDNTKKKGFKSKSPPSYNELLLAPPTYDSAYHNEIC